MRSQSPEPVTRDQLPLQMAGEQRPQVGVPRAGGTTTGDRLAPHGVGDQVGQEPVVFVVCRSVHRGKSRKLDID